MLLFLSIVLEYVLTRVIAASYYSLHLPTLLATRVLDASVSKVRNCIVPGVCIPRPLLSYLLYSLLLAVDWQRHISTRGYV